jgi:CBS domain-containing protein
MPRDLPVTEIMTTDVLTFTGDTTVEDAAAALAERGISGAPVVDADGRLLGLFDDADLIVAEARIHGPSAIELLGAYIPLPESLQRFHDEVRHALARTVGDLLDDDDRADAPRVGLDATVEDVATLMHDRRASRVPVVDDAGRVVGIVSRGDIVGAIGRRP